MAKWKQQYQNAETIRQQKLGRKVDVVTNNQVDEVLNLF